MADPLRDALQASLGATYTIQREIGGGGMSRVFLADETRFGRNVVIKVLPPDVAGSISADRFEREIQLVARLQHPHIVPLLTAGEVDGSLYYTMPFVQGESLRERIVRDGKLPHDEALRLATEVADALACAHRDGVVHRDIKPENILLSGGHAVVTDFGIAKAIALSKDGDGEPALTQLGTSLGTAAYMSPEQAAGESDLDGRSDIYSLGCVLYEMLAGRQPFTGATAAGVIAKRFMETPTPLRTLDGTISVDTERTVTRAMEREPSARFATAVEVVDALTAATASNRRQQRTDDDTPSVAVLPFTNLSANADDEYFSDGMTDEVINALAHLPGLRVAARSSAFVFKGQRVDLRTVAQQLSVRTILEGTVRRAGTRVRISVQLIGATDGLHLWSERYDRELADVFALQDEIAQSIVAALAPRFGGAAPAPVARAAVDPAAYDVYLRGRFLFERYAATDAIACFERAVALDPTFAAAHAWQGLAYMMASNLNVMPALVGYPRGREAVDRALAIESRLPEALFARGIIAGWFDWDQPRAEKVFREVIVAAPGFPNAHELLGFMLLSDGRIDEGMRSMEHAYALDPLSDFMLMNLTRALILAGNANRAITLLRPAVERPMGTDIAHLLLGAALFAANELAEARKVLERARDLAPGGGQLRATLACVLAAMGETDAARQRLREVEAQAERGTGSAVEVACGYHWLGDDDSAYAWLDRALNVRELWMPWIHLEPRLRRLRATPRFGELVQRVRLARREAD